MLPASHEPEEPLEMHGNRLPGSGFAAVSWVMLMLVLGCGAYLAFFMPRGVRAYEEIFKDFRVELPAATKAILMIPPWVYYLAGAALAAPGIALQLMLRSKRDAAVFHVLLIALSGIIYTLYHEAMLQPMISLIQSVSGGSHQ
jgi:hypothetical protein